MLNSFFYEEFREYALKITGLWGHIKADEIYAMAWNTGYEGGEEEVLYHLDDMVNILLKDKINS